MQQERYSGAGFQNRDSFHQRFNSNQSIDRFNFRSSSPGLNSKVNLIDAMDIEMPDRRSDFYQNILGDQIRSSSYRRSSNISRADRTSGLQRSSGIDIEAPDQEARVRSSNQRNIHECTCDKECNQQHCVCFYYSNELCVMGLCCPGCVKLKIQLMNQSYKSTPTHNGCFCKNIKCLKMYCSCYRDGKKCGPFCKCQGCQNDTDNLIDKKKKSVDFNAQRQRINNYRNNYHMEGRSKMVVQTMNYSFLNCNCKKSHCLKKYCSCYVNGRSCNQTCSCQDCHNKFEDDNNSQSKSQKQARIARYGRHESQDSLTEDKEENNDIGQYLQQEDNFDLQELNPNMEFQPVNFQDAGR